MTQNSKKGATWHLCESSCRQRRTARRLGADHHRLQSAAPPDGRRRPAASRTRQSDRPQMLIHHCVQQIHFCKMTVLHRCQHFLHQRMSCNSAFSQRAIPEYFNDPPAFFSEPNCASHGLFSAVNCLILPLPMLLAHLQPCSLLASASHKCLITAPDCAAQRASNAPSSAG